MSPSNAQELAFLQDLDIVQTAQQAERDKLLAQARLKKPPQECSLSQEEMWEMHEAMLREVEENEKQKSRRKAEEKHGTSKGKALDENRKGIRRR